ncbi:hypothetical protein Tsubulata_011075 [Turnera subulata]|uniref:Uncharacterized protein n=1 Tax=Turnera subulata TaxID=218843 RepID=A0A9Q0F9L9_9ROSI|nr:hypothetical protein Tsubulata_011075 [Turnera subulata]
MLKSPILFRPPLLIEPKELHPANPNLPKKPGFTIITCSSSSSSSSRSHVSIPKRSPFGPASLTDRYVIELPMIEKTRQRIADYCCTLEGLPCHSCWTAYFEIRDFEREWPKEDVEDLLRVTGELGCENLIRRIHSATRLLQEKKCSSWLAFPKDEEDEEEEKKSTPKLGKSASDLATSVDVGKQKESMIMEKNSASRAAATPVHAKEGKDGQGHHIPDGLPTSQEDMEEDGMEFSWTRFLRRMGRGSSNWYTPMNEMSW